MKKEILFCSTLKAMRKEVEQIESFINTKMVTDVAFMVDSFEERGIEKHNITIRIDSLHMEYGIIDNWFNVNELVSHNKDVLIDTIVNHYENDITGVIRHNQFDKLYIVQDLQEPESFWYSKLDDVRQFILEQWTSEWFDSPEEEEEHDRQVLNGDFDYLKERCLGMDFVLVENEEERLIWIKEE